MENPEISIIIPAYNAGKTLKQTLESLVRQTFKNFEVVLIDDGSTDETKNIITEFQRKSLLKIRYLYQRNKGPAAARNLGLKNAKGKFIAFLDSDDIFLPTRLEKIYKKMKKDNLDWVTTDAFLWYPPQKPTKRYYQNFPLPKNKNLENMLIKNFVFGLPLIKRKIIKKIGFLDESLNGVEDYEYWIRILSAGFKLGFVLEPLVLYRQREGSFSRKEEKLEKAKIKMFAKIEKNLKLLPKEKLAIEKQKAKIFLSLALKYLDEENTSLFFLRKSKSFKAKLAIFLLKFDWGKRLIKKYLTIKYG